MFEFESQQARTAELLRQADHQRLVREAQQARKQERRAAKDAAEGPVKSPRDHFGRAA
ncbi:hypothetical protein [Streptomyces sp. 150FB]|uniref:hypothetical protein n=1 Tax=Streptomyces sp. 150FB TaxID=1576605 RepID=UPI001567E414|nr:hypothetical protein [Streptomyces sp. 150FB]